MEENPLPLLPVVLAHVPPGLKQALAQDGLPTTTAPEGGRFVLFDSRLAPPPALAAGQQALDVAGLRVAGVADPLAALADERSAPHAWQSAGLTAIEEIARCDKRWIRRELLAELRAALLAAGGVWLRVAAYPQGYRTAFNFRIDYDYYEPEAFQATRAALADAGDCTSHYVNGAAYAEHGRALRSLRGLDVGSHAYWHHIYRGEADNYANLARGIHVLRRAGIEPCSFVAPHGRFHRGLLAAVERLGIGHSSEFGLAYDELPFTPHGSRVLQVPIHPVCPELFLESAPREQALAAAWQHFQRMAQAKYAAGEPLFFYGHPTGRYGAYPELLTRLVRDVGRMSGVWRTTHAAFAAWWRARAEVALRVQREGEHLLIAADRLPAGYRLALECVAGQRLATIRLYGDQVRCHAAQLAYEERGAGLGDRPQRVVRAWGLRGHVKRILDWERVTPADQIVVRDWRTWTKRTLRRWQERHGVNAPIDS